MVRLPILSITAVKPLVVLGAIALALAIQPAQACEKAAQDIEEPFAIVGDSGYLPFYLGSVSSEVEEPIEVAEPTPPDNSDVIEPILMAGSFEFD